MTDRAVLLRIAAACTLTCMLGADDSQPAPTNLRGAEYPRVHSDNRVTFRLKAPGARKVQLQPNMVELNTPGTENGLGKGPYDMVRGEDGVWTVTTPPAVPGFHLYHFLVDDLAANDPGSQTVMTGMPELGYGQSYLCSGIEVPEKETDADFYLPHDVPHGVVQELWYYSKVTAAWRRVHVYTPPTYDRDSEARYPVLYLQHGGAEDDGSWSQGGRVNFIMDNLLAAKKAVPMLVVMDHGYANKPGESDPYTAEAYAAQDPVSRALFEELVIRDLIPTIDTRYRTIADREHRAIAGMSRGARQAVQIGLHHLDTFAYLGGFSTTSVARDFKPEVYDNGIFTKVDLLNSKLKLLWFGDGMAELNYPALKQFHETLTKLGVKHAYYESPGTAHEWLTFRRELHEFAPHLFRPE